MALPDLRGERLALRPVTDRDVPSIATILSEPEVARWWGRYDRARVRREALEDPAVEALVVEIDGEPGGVLYVNEERDADFRHVALDIALAARFQGRGYGREALRLVIDHLIAAHGHHRFTIDPEVGNEAAIRCYEAVGFRPVGVMRRYTRGLDGGWADGLLMDLLADELL
ncbi:MAG: GNAT family N-acetyltransferase [Actinobacteria bacterium]|nr:GNAT family N-acetyltransferase [Actinomycetota bacterium]